eukprot:TRINITY_DN5195_c0_g1_i1.p1 TRINITY_DN5195_c0_g1~~TRINITY_DN5195_c0_g1_i1.p1  ORF type:complete len:1266 (+),score=480.31 TRINITY_DN5195_c0_g1_i1:73-3870(+)
MEPTRPMKREREEDGFESQVEGGQDQVKFQRTEDSGGFQLERPDGVLAAPLEAPDAPPLEETLLQAPPEAPLPGSYMAPPPSMVVPPTTYTASQPSSPPSSLQSQPVLQPESLVPDHVRSPTSLSEAQPISQSAASHAAEHIAHMQAGAPSAAPNSVKQVKFENALDFLDQVKLQFANQPKVYNQFLDIMKDFKAQCIDTPGVIARVSELFKGHKNLILGFNTFLPPGYKIEYVPDDESDAMSSGNFIVTQPPPQVPLQAGFPIVAPQPPRKQPEFDHARNYVKKIKMRFSNQPQTYKQFLEILHTYHKEQHTIKDVYEQVAKLFASHADLLDEFTQFLPDPMAQAPPLPVFAQAAAQGARPKKPRPKVKEVKERDHHREHLHRELEREREREREAREREREIQLERQREREMQREREKQMRKEMRKKQRAQQEEQKIVPNGSYEEQNFFYRVKNRLNNQLLYMEFLKCLNMFSNNVISRLELVLLVKDILSRHRDLFDWFKQFIGFDDPSIEFIDKQDDRPAGTRGMADFDLKNCKRYGPSYRAVPKAYVQPICSGRTELCNQVLNDQWISMAVGSEEGVFKNQRKNQYEEMLFKCEDDRFELDLIIEQNAAAIRALEQVLKSLGEPQDEAGNRLRMETSLDILNLRAIERIYGDKGPEVCELMYENPAAILPIILKRLRMKDVEWIRARQEWNKTWREVNEKNYYKSLDYQSFSFRQADRKSLQPKSLMAEIKQAYHQDLRRVRGAPAARTEDERVKEHETLDLDQAAAAADGKAEESAENGVEEPSDSTPAAPSVPSAPLMPLDRQEPHLNFLCEDPRLFNDVVNLILFSADRSYANRSEFKMEREKMEVFFSDFLRKFLFLEPGVPEPADDADAPPAAPAPERRQGDEEPAAMETEAPAAVTEPTPSETSISVATGEAPMVEAVSSADELATPAPASAPVEAVASAAEQLPPPVPQVQTFYGNDVFYFFFRLFLTIYERLRRAQELAEANQNTSVYVYILKPEKRSCAEDPRAKYLSFIKALKGVIAGSKDMGTFEDECRSWFGMQSFALFTMDKLVHQTVKQVQQLLSEEVCTELLKLWSHQNVVPAASRDVVYYSNCVEQLENERVFRFRAVLTGERRELGVLMLNPSHTPPEYVGIPLDKHSKWSQYVSNYLMSEESQVDPRARHVFMLRNTKKAPQSLADAQENALSDSNLEVRICLSTYRLFYVENTEDYFYRKGSAARAAERSQRRTADQRKERAQQVVEKLAKRLASTAPAAQM